MTIEHKKIPLVDLKAQYRSIEAEIQSAITRILETTSFIMGKDVREFENEFADFCGAKYAIGVASGTAALHLALKAAGVGPGDDVITVSHTFVATAEAIEHCGARPVFVDVDPLTFTMDPSLLEARISEKTRAILPVHLYGQCADMDAIMATAAKYDIPVVEDAAQAHGATYKGRKAGTIGIAGCFSFYPGKNLGAFGDAGAVVTNDAVIAERIQMMRDHGRSEKYVHQEVGYGERLDTLQAAILRVKLEKLPEWNDKRRYWAQRYSDALSGIQEIKLPQSPTHGEHVYHLYVIQSSRRDELLGYLKENGVMAGIHYPLPLHLQPAFRYLEYEQGDFPVTEQLAKSILSLPLYPEIDEESLNWVVANISNFYNGS